MTKMVKLKLGDVMTCKVHTLVNGETGIRSQY